MAISGILMHSLVDFNLQIPANVLLFLTQASLAVAPAVASRSPSFRQKGLGSSELMVGSS